MSAFVRIMKKLLKFFIVNKPMISYLLSYMIILYISSFHLLATIFINLVLMINFIKLILNTSSESCNNENKNLNSFLYSLLIGNYITFQTLVYSYKEILGWELAIAILLNVLFIYYLYYLKIPANKKNIVSINQYNKFLQFNNNSSLKSQLSPINDHMFSCRL